MTSWIQPAYQRIWQNGDPPTIQLEGVACLPSYVNQEITIVRDEYIEIWDYIEKARVVPNRIRIEGLVLLGQPGIGKSLFLQYAFARTLSQKSPVVFCDDPNYYWFCDDRGTQILPLSTPSVDIIPRGTLILVDSNAGMPNMPALFGLALFQGYVVQASSPDTSRWYQWKKERRAKIWIMGLWTKDEVLSLQNIRENNLAKGGSEGFPPVSCPWKLEHGATYSPMELFDILGPSARTCFSDYIKSGRGYEFDFFSESNPSRLLLDSRTLYLCIQYHIMPEGHQGEIFRQFFFGSLSKNISNPVDLPGFAYDVPTFFLRRILFTHFRSLEQKILASAIPPHSQLSYIFYESAAIIKLESSPTDYKFKLCEFPGTSTLQPGLQVDPSPFYPDVFDAEKFPFAPKDNWMYIPYRGFESCDAFVVTGDAESVIFLQFTTAREHDLKPGGIYSVVKCFPKDKRQSMSWTFLFVSPTERAKRMAMGHHLNRFKVEGEEIIVSIGWMVVETGDAFDEVMTKFAMEDSVKRRRIGE